MSLRFIHLVGGIFLARDMTLETIGAVSDTPQVRLPAMTA